MAKDRPDFVMVQLNAFGVQYAGEGTLTIVEGGRKFEFTPGEAQEVTKAFDWGMVLSKQHIDGELLFEVVADDSQQGA